MSSFPDSVVDDDGNIHHLLKEPLGRGGQGVVLRTRSPHIAVKLIGEFTESAPSIESKQGASQELWNQLTRVPGFDVAPDGEKRRARTTHQRTSGEGAVHRVVPAAGLAAAGRSVFAARFVDWQRHAFDVGSQMFIFCHSLICM